MNPTRKFFLKLTLICFIIIVIQSIWKIAPSLKMWVWLALLCFLLLALAHPIGKPLHMAWRAYVNATSQGMRFLQGAGLVFLAIAAYQLLIPDNADQRIQNFLDAPFSPGPETFVYFLYLGVIALIVGFIRRAADVLFAGWMKVAHLIQAVVSKVLLLLIYLITIFPIGLLAKIVGKRFLEKNIDSEATSYWKERESIKFEPSRYERHF